MYVRPFKGEVNIGRHSGLRKLARAMRRGKVPEDRAFVIDQATRRASERKAAYLNSSPDKRGYRAKTDPQLRAARAKRRASQ